jgi:hypothetical protein
MCATSLIKWINRQQALLATFVVFDKSGAAESMPKSCTLEKNQYGHLLMCNCEIDFAQMHKTMNLVMS